jgi:hypothetical protein
MGLVEPGKGVSIRCVVVVVVVVVVVCVVVLFGG